MCKLLSTEPCNNCPYRKDAPLRLWHYSEFLKLLENDVKGISNPNEGLGQAYGCHKQNGNTCVGWLITQLKSDNPSLMARITAIRLQSGEFAENLKAAMAKDVDLYSSLKEMVIANYPEFEGKI